MARVGIRPPKDAADIQRWAGDVQRALNEIDAMVNRLASRAMPLQPRAHVVADLPPPTGRGIILVTDETGGAVLAFSDGENWRRVTDRAVVS